MICSHWLSEIANKTCYYMSYMPKKTVLPFLRLWNAFCSLQTSNLGTIWSTSQTGRDRLHQGCWSTQQSMEICLGPAGAAGENLHDWPKFPTGKLLLLLVKPVVLKVVQSSAKHLVWRWSIGSPLRASGLGVPELEGEFGRLRSRSVRGGTASYTTALGQIWVSYLNLADEFSSIALSKAMLNFS